jgi:hypothetical protein
VIGRVLMVVPILLIVTAILGTMMVMIPAKLVIQGHAETRPVALELRDERLGSAVTTMENSGLSNECMHIHAKYSFNSQARQKYS